MQPNPYESPGTKVESPGFHRHCCPACGTKVPLKRQFLRSHLWARWPCNGCGRILRIDVGRRILVAVCGTFLYAGFVLAGCVAFWLTKTWLAAVPFGLLAFVPIASVFYFDVIRLAEHDP